MFKFDTHVHTAESSSCGSLSAKETVDRYLKAGFDGICITDHYSPFEFTGNFEWEQKIKRFLTGYRIASEYGSYAGLTVLLGAEITFSDSPNDYLLFGLTESFFFDFPALSDYKFPVFRKLAKEHGILIFQAHPFRSYVTRQNPSLLDGVEIINGNARHNSNNGLAKKFALENNLYVSGGSDCHETEDVGRSGIITDIKIQNIEMLKQCLTDGSAKVIEL